MIDPNASKVALLRHLREQSKSEDFTLERSEAPSSVPHLLQVAQADRPSASQKERACLSMLNEAREIIESLDSAFSGMGATEIAALLKDPDSRILLEDRLEEATAKLAAVRSQCGDVLPADEMKKLNELEKKLNDVRDLLGDDNPTGPDLLAIAEMLLEAVGNGVKVVLSVIAIMMRLFFGPDPRRAENQGENAHRGSGRLVAQNTSAEDLEPHRGSGRLFAQSTVSEDLDPHRGSGRFDEISHRGSGRLIA